MRVCQRSVRRSGRRPWTFLCWMAGGRGTQGRIRMRRHTSSLLGTSPFTTPPRQQRWLVMIMATVSTPARRQVAGSAQCSVTPIAASVVEMSSDSQHSQPPLHAARPALPILAAASSSTGTPTRDARSTRPSWERSRRPSDPPVAPTYLLWLTSLRTYLYASSD